MAGRITAIQPQARRKNRFNLYVDERFALSVSGVIAARLQVGQTLTADDLAALEHAEAFETAHEQALQFLTPRPRSSAELRQHLRKKQAAEPVVDQVIAALSGSGLLDDEAFARYWVENREAFRPRSARALQFELRRKGLTDAAIAQAVKAVDESESAYRAGAARAQRWLGLSRREFMDKLGAFLVRRGFAYETAREAAKRRWEETHES
ncbi:MAG: RecX family transcriptional regulator [Chloroflexi bacterium]|nr:RecX family transcriptional regulator [Chloroflexota bacterium]